MNLYHYTCSHGLAAIEADNWTLRPNLFARHLKMPQVVWLTDMPEPDRWALGLTKEILDCDRGEHRLTVPNIDSVLPWSNWCRENGYTRMQRDALEWGQAQPRHWFVSSQPIRCEPLP